MNARNHNIVSFVLANTDHGALIVSRLDYRADAGHHGVGMHLLTHRQHEMEEINSIKELLADRGRQLGAGVVMIDGGAHVGIHTVELANWMRGWGSVIAVEPQKRLFYALCGNIALGNLWNAEAVFGALDKESGTALIPEMDYTSPAQYGGFELPGSEGSREPLGQDYGEPSCIVRTIAIDDMGLDRIDLIKLDVEGMELRALRGATESIKRFRPIMTIEHLKVGADRIIAELSPLGYKCAISGNNLIATPISSMPFGRATLPAA